MKVVLWFLTPICRDVFITCGETVEKAVVNAADAKREWIEAALEEGIK